MMVQEEQFPESDPRYHTSRVKGMLREVIDHLREDIQEIDEPRAEAMFETSAEVLTGIVTAFTHYEEQSEPAWRED